MILTLLKFYLAINLLVALTYGLFKATRGVISLTRVGFSYLTLNRVAQALVAAAIIFPILFAGLPQGTIPDAKINIREPLADSVALNTISKMVYASHASEVNGKDAESGFVVASGYDIKTYSLILLIFGFILIFNRLAKNFLILKRILRDSYLVRKIGKIRILVSDEICIPFSTLIGVGANIVLPTDVMGSRKDLQLVIRHELHHHRNGDTVWVLLMEVACCFLYLNPFIYLWKKEITEIQEFACDEMLISQMRVSAYEYSQCLIKVAEAARGIYSMQVGTTCMGAGPKSPQQLKSFLRRRIEMFRDHQSHQKKKFFGLALGTICLLITMGAAYGAQKSLRSKVILKPNSGIAKYDPVIQNLTEGILKKYVGKFGAKGGFVLVADSQTGRLLAVANQISNSDKAEKSWALSYEMEPASIMKGLVVASAIDQNLIQVDDYVNCENGKYIYGGRTYEDWKRFGDLTTTEAVVNSSNICGIKIGERLGAIGLEASLKNFGFGPGGVAAEFPGAMPGRYPKAKEIPETDYIPLISVGYTSMSSFYVTPLEVLQAYGAIANDGKLMKPLEYSEALSASVVMRRAISAESANKMKSILVEVVKNGTGKNAQSRLYTTAGKTSTAFSPDSKEHGSLGGDRAMAGFVGFAPAQNSRLVVYVGVIDPTNSKDGNPHGSQHAAPVFKEVIETVLQHMKVAPDKKNSI